MLAIIEDIELAIIKDIILGIIKENARAIIINEGWFIIKHKDFEVKEEVIMQVH